MIESPEHLKHLDLPALDALAADIRQKIITVCLKNGGHLGASLGAVEIALALHKSFNSPHEPIFWDVGHQAYAHKLLTGRWKQFETLRKKGGISGFLSRAESEHDVFGAGHSSTSLSAALAAAWARRVSDSWTIAVIGDGGLTAGLALEALQQIRGLDIGPMLIVVNDNQMSISPNVGAVPALLSDGKAADFFDALGLDYVGPMDGHDLSQLLGFLSGLRSNYLGRPVVLHLLTQKGRGYEPAESSPVLYHGVSPVSGGAKPGHTHATWSELFVEQLIEWARVDSKVVAITAAMPEGTGLNRFAELFPDRFFDVGIAEGHALTFAAGLAAQGFKPVVAIYSTFLQRGWDSLIHDIALQGLGVVIAVDRAGLVGADGPTHHGVFDITLARAVPGLSLWAPSGESEMAGVFDQLRVRDLAGPVLIRYPRGAVPLQSEDRFVEDGEGAHWRLVTEVPEHVQFKKAPWLLPFDKASFGLISFGHARKNSEAAIARATKAGNTVLHVQVNRIKPISKILRDYISIPGGAPWISVEEGVASGGAGEGLASLTSSAGARFSALGYPDAFVGQGGVGELEREAKVDVDTIAGAIHSALTVRAGAGF